MIEATGVNGSIRLADGIVTVTRKGIGNRGTKTIPLDKIGGVQIRPATMLVNGFLQLSVVGEISRSKGGVGRLQDAANDENAVIFTRKNAADFEALRDALMAAQTTV